MKRDLIRRRYILGQLLTMSSLPLFFKTALSLADAGQAGASPPPKNNFMHRAFEMKRIAVDSGDQAYGAIVVRDDEIVGKGPSRVIIDRDPTSHAEVVAIRDAARTLGERHLDGCVLYSTSKPCAMCETAAYWAHISRMYYSAEIVDGGVPAYPACD